MKKLAVVAVFLLSGCIDAGRIGTDPELKQIYLDGTPDEVAECLFSAALSQHLHLEQDGELPEAVVKYSLMDGEEEVAWVDILASGHKQSIVSFYQAKEPAVRNAVSAMAARCKDALF